jgi:hypothetical protein
MKTQWYHSTLHKWPSQARRRGTKDGEVSHHRTWGNIGRWNIGLKKTCTLIISACGRWFLSPQQEISNPWPPHLTFHCWQKLTSHWGKKILDTHLYFLRFTLLWVWTLSQMRPKGKCARKLLRKVFFQNNKGRNALFSSYEHVPICTQNIKVS